jgi:hypothetical protein
MSNSPPASKTCPEELLGQFIEQFAALAEAQQKQLEAAGPVAEQTVDVNRRH